MTFEGRMKATKNLVQNGISNLIVIGGDGSLTGAQKLKEQWPESLKKLQETGELIERIFYLVVSTLARERRFARRWKASHLDLSGGSGKFINRMTIDPVMNLSF